jgi:TldD protein
VRLRSIAWFLILCAPPFCFAQDKVAADPVRDILRQELDRSFSALKKTATPPYFISYELTNRRTATVDSSFGALTRSNDSQTRVLDLDLRIGDYKLDSTHGGGMDFGSFESRGQIPIEEGADALRVALWLETDRRYKDAVQRFEAIQTNQQLKSDDGDKSPDFSTAQAETHLDAPVVLGFERSVWEEKVRQYGRAFRSVPDIVDADVSASGVVVTKRYVNTEGTATTTSRPIYTVIISASVRAEDGEVIPLHQTYMAFTPEGLPSDQEVTSAVAHMIEMLRALEKAPVADAYTGPAILSSRASAVFFHEIFGHRIEGARLKADDDAQTFKKKLHQQVLPQFLSVYSDPTIQRAAGTDLVGYYTYDDEGVKARRVTIVEKGTLETFLMSRSPNDQLVGSNGHGRREEGYRVAARQSNLVVSPTRTMSREQLKKMLLERVKASNKPYGLLFDDIEGGFTFTSRNVPNSFKVMPTVVYRVYPDGHEELVRGLDLIGTPLIAFSKIAAADDQIGVFNGTCGAESGEIPVSAVAPGLLLEQIEVQRKPKSQDNRPILPGPVDGQF